MIKAKFPHVAGLQDVSRSDTCTFEEEDGQFVQILNIHDTLDLHDECWVQAK